MSENSMTRADIIKHVSQTAEIAMTKAEEIVKTIFDDINAALAEGKTVSVYQFGVFKPVLRAARTGHNPQNPQQSVEIPERKVVKFKMSQTLKEAMNG